MGKAVPLYSDSGGRELAELTPTDASPEDIRAYDLSGCDLIRKRFTGVTGNDTWTSGLENVVAMASDSGGDVSVTRSGGTFTFLGGGGSYTVTLYVWVN